MDKLKKHIDYLSSLHLIGDNWTGPGISKAPTKEVCDTAKFFLTQLRYNETVDILLGPIPKGGVAIEMHLSKVNRIHIHMFNDNTIESEIYVNQKEYEFLNCTRESLLEILNKILA